MNQPASSLPLRFIPSRVENRPDVSHVCVFPDRLELHSLDRVEVFRFSDILPPRPLARKFGRLAVIGERDWFHPPSQRFFRFYTSPPLAVFLPDEPADTPYDHALFRRIQDVMLSGGFVTYDLG